MTDLQMRPRWTAHEVAKYLGVGVKRVYELPIPQIRLGERTIRYDPDDVVAFEKERKNGRGRR